MNHREEAKRIYTLFFRTTPQPACISEVEGVLFDTWDKDWTHKIAKEQSLIHVDEMIKYQEMLYEHYWIDLSDYIEIRKEIEKMV